ncbi:hypothetical protein PGT21_028436 [Puccinia graminis f. sp. tritici]|uniref:Uncharacterized protein n=2 Tax=Puccinia graminis f. sp. tritici TaxID=56615 RepID=H6QRZ5_PUCGT|nr:uncharacterized protein PGTG_21563 [Puccinia graminis f. sp. tritici CRL 75-36-700-3]EHS63430.1 hypothetical protein PGTG_21563 [Puccinia graminis f. sp. tritici CRL 75-36-700-3]KAA1066324.1 hypothetical protein PGT21_028436 [Puccinia graminis f. sp. tritici]KAA1128357.1 hypothetical protein PGTUg99_013672 [Puccinia graminis f. sp. tritici]
MQIATVSILAILATLSAATPAADTHHQLQARKVNCKNIVPACFGGQKGDKSTCRCKGQKGDCDLWTCPGSSAGAMVCGQEESGCVFL